MEQVFLVERYSYAPDGTLLSAVAVLGVTSLTAQEAGPDDLLAYLRGHWAIEMHHYLRSPGAEPGQLSSISAFPRVRGWYG
ncbi:MAG: hypothetical protein M3Z75_23890 [Actinomycetota bacterium]|nr:hypothetical protein [Actinomycetota bacterium]